MLGTGPPVSIYKTKSPIDMWRHSVPQLKINLNIYFKTQISIKLFYLYQRLQCTDNYFFKIEFVFFLYLLLSASRKENELSWYISVIRQTVGYRTAVFMPFSWHLHISIVKPLIHQSELRTVAPFQEKSSFHFVVLRKLLNGVD